MTAQQRDMIDQILRNAPFDLGGDPPAQRSPRRRPAPPPRPDAHLAAAASGRPSNARRPGWHPRGLHRHRARRAARHHLPHSRRRLRARLRGGIGRAGVQPGPQDRHARRVGRLPARARAPLPRRAPRRRDRLPRPARAGPAAPTRSSCRASRRRQPRHRAPHRRQGGGPDDARGGPAAVPDDRPHRDRQQLRPAKRTPTRPSAPGPSAPGRRTTWPAQTRPTPWSAPSSPTCPDYRRC